MSRRRRRLIIILAGTQSRLSLDSIGEIQFQEPEAADDIEWEDETINESALTQGESDCLNDLAVAFPD